MALVPTEYHGGMEDWDSKSRELGHRPVVRAGVPNANQQVGEMIGLPRAIEVFSGAVGVLDCTCYLRHTQNEACTTVSVVLLSLNLLPGAARLFGRTVRILLQFCFRPQKDFSMTLPPPPPARASSPPHTYSSSDSSV